MKRIFFVTVIIEAEDSHKSVRPDVEQVRALFDNRINRGEVEEKLFRKNVCMNVLDRKIDVRQLI